MVLDQMGGRHKVGNLEYLRAEDMPMRVGVQAEREQRIDLDVFLNRYLKLKR